uniref:hypothetical protein n=1 Tax=Streptomyces sp. LS1784 TaxID=2851533 RepID=UPI001CD021E1
MIQNRYWAGPFPSSRTSRSCGVSLSVPLASPTCTAPCGSSSVSIPRNSGPVIGAAALGDPPGDAPTATVPGPGSRPPNAAV